MQCRRINFASLLTGVKKRGFLSSTHDSSSPLVVHERLLLIDNSALAYRSFFANEKIPLLTYTRCLLYILRNFRSDYIGLVLDDVRRDVNPRTIMYPQYKVHHTDEIFVSQ